MHSQEIIITPDNEPQLTAEATKLGPAHLLALTEQIQRQLSKNSSPGA